MKYRLFTSRTQSAGPARGLGIKLLGGLLLAVLCAVSGAILLETKGSNAQTASAPVNGAYLSPTALAASSNGETLFIACATANQVIFFDLKESRTERVAPVPASPLGLALSRDGARLYVTCAAPESVVAIIDTANGKPVRTIPAGHTAMAPVLSPDGRTLYVCNRFNDNVSFIDLESGREIKRVPVPREPVAAAVTSDGKHLLVANHLHAGRADVDFVASSVSVIDTEAGKVIREIVLPNGSGLLRDVSISPDGKYAAVTHLVSRFHLPTTQIERGWINTNALSLIDLDTLELINTVLLDNIDSGAANPWAAAWTADGRRLCVTHAGTHELSIIDFPALLAKLRSLPESLTPGQTPNYGVVSRIAADVPNDLSFLVGLRRRVKLPEGDRGPRALALVGNTAYVANYFTDSLSVIEMTERPVVRSMSLGSQQEMSVVRRGEFLFNDAGICFQGWQSCASCHSSDGRVDALNWDNLNDGIGNPKNVKSLLLAHETPPMMALGVRADAETAVRAGIRNSLFTVQPEAVAEAMDEYLKSLQPIPSPFLVDGKLSPAAERGRKLFMSDAVGCADCHTPGLFTNLRSYDVGTAGKFDKPTDRFDTPTLIELWRTAPYLHDGRAVTVREVLTIFNEEEKHGATSHLTEKEIDDLVEYVLSL